MLLGPFYLNSTGRRCTVSKVITLHYIQCMGHHLRVCISNDSHALGMLRGHMDVHHMHVRPHLHGPQWPVLGAADFADMAAVSLSSLWLSTLSKES